MYYTLHQLSKFILKHIHLIFDFNFWLPNKKSLTFFRRVSALISITGYKPFNFKKTLIQSIINLTPKYHTILFGFLLVSKYLDTRAPE